MSAIAVGLGAVTLADFGPIWVIPVAWAVLLATYWRAPETRRPDFITYAGVTLVLSVMANAQVRPSVVSQ